MRGIKRDVFSDQGNEGGAPHPLRKGESRLHKVEGWEVAPLGSKKSPPGGKKKT